MSNSWHRLLIWADTFKPWQTWQPDRLNSDFATWALGPGTEFCGGSVWFGLVWSGSEVLILIPPSWKQMMHVKLSVDRINLNKPVWSALAVLSFAWRRVLPSIRCLQGREIESSFLELPLHITALETQKKIAEYLWCFKELFFTLLKMIWVSNFANKC